MNIGVSSRSLKVYDGEIQELSACALMKLFCTLLQFVKVQPYLQEGMESNLISQIRFVLIPDMIGGFLYNMLLILDIYISALVLGRLVSRRMRADQFYLIARYGMKRTDRQGFLCSDFSILAMELFQTIFLGVMIWLHDASLLAALPIRNLLLYELLVVLAIRVHVLAGNLFISFVGLRWGSILLMAVLFVEEFAACEYASVLWITPLSMICYSNAQAMLLNGTWVMAAGVLLFYNILLQWLHGVKRRTMDLL